MTKVAVVAGAPSSRLLAPYSDSEWLIWACSPSNSVANQLPRVDEWFELHPMAKIREEQRAEKPFYDWLNAQSFGVWMQEENECVPRAKKFPAAELLGRYPRNFFGSSVSWMAGLALNTFDNATLTLGFWGVDMSSQEEYISQRPGLQSLCDYAERHGVKLVAPYASDILTPPILYGYSAGQHMATKLRVRGQELRARIAEHRQEEMVAHDKRIFLEGALEDLEYMQRVWGG